MMDKNDLITIIKSTTHLVEIYDDEWLSSSKFKRHPVQNLLKQGPKKAKTAINNLDVTVSKILSILRQDSKKDEKIKHFEGKLRDSHNFLNYLPEFRWAEILSNISTEVIIEPTYPKKGHDIEANIDRPIAFEILSFTASEDERRRNHIRKELTQKINIPSKFSVFILVNVIDVENTDIYAARKIIIKKIKEFSSKNITHPSRFYYFNKDDIREWSNFDGIHYPKDCDYNNYKDYDEFYKKYPLYFEGRDALITFTLINNSNNEMRPHTPIIIGGAGSSENGKRFKRIISDKICQLPNDMPCIVIGHVSTYSDKELIENALFGELGITMRIEPVTGKKVDEYMTRNKNGVFHISTRISAVIVYVDTMKNNKRIFKGDIYLNPKASKPLNKIEERLFKKVLK